VPYAFAIRPNELGPPLPLSAELNVINAKIIFVFFIVKQYFFIEIKFIFKLKKLKKIKCINYQNYEFFFVTKNISFIFLYERKLIIVYLKNTRINNFVI